MIVLDTKVVSELMSPSPTSNALDWTAGQAVPPLHISAINESDLR